MVQTSTKLYNCTQLCETRHNFRTLYTSLHNSTNLHTTIHDFTKLYITLPNSTRLYKSSHNFTQLCKTFTQFYNTTRNSQKRKTIELLRKLYESLHICAELYTPIKNKHNTLYKHAKNSTNYKTSQNNTQLYNK
jgi:hypothetical protein